jgi:hypothetical protein
MPRLSTNRAGWAENLTIDWRGYGLPNEQFPTIALELIKVRPDVSFYAMLQFAPYGRQQRRFRSLP